MLRKLLLTLILPITLHAGRQIKKRDIKENIIIHHSLRPIVNTQVPQIAQPVNNPQSWTPISAEQAEYDRIMAGCLQIRATFVANFGPDSLRGSGIHNAIFYYLKNIGTPISLRIVKEKISNKELPESYLKLI